MISTTEKISAIREACCAANPEIKELKFGCEGIEDGKKFVNLGDGSWQMKDKEFWGFSSVSPEKILGRPIRLTDVLLAIDAKGDPRGNYVKVNGRLGGAWGEYIKEISWNLRKDSIDDQDEVTISFLYEVLVGNKDDREVKNKARLCGCGNPAATRSKLCHDCVSTRNSF